MADDAVGQQTGSEKLALPSSWDRIVAVNTRTDTKPPLRCASILDLPGREPGRPGLLASDDPVLTADDSDDFLVAHAGQSVRGSWRKLTDYAASSANPTLISEFCAFSYKE
ncbi:MAG: hypothetical protein OXH78_13915 [Acidimicrobiaceae bacterium]|nr:hypothetical protein [Acidimicrobiaceae bacterium]